MLTVDDIDWEGEVPLSSVMFHWRPVYPHDGDWEDTVRVLTECPGEAIEINTLREELRENGRFDEPIYLSHQEREVDKHDGEVYEESWTVGNGTHRVVASYLEGVETIWATTSQHETPPEEYQVISIELDLDITNADHTCEPSDGDKPDAVDFMVDYLRSFRLDEETWVEFEGAVGTCMYYICPHEKRDALVAKVLDLCESHGAEASVIEVVTETYSDDDDEDED